MESKRARELTSRVLSGDRLTLAEEQWLLDRLEQRPEDRDAFLADEAMDSLLQCLARLDTSEEHFVEMTLGRIADRDPRRPGDDIEEYSEEGIESDSDECHVSIAPNTHSRKRRLSRRHMSWRSATAVSCAVLLLILGAVWVLSPRGQRGIEPNRPITRVPGENLRIPSEGSGNPAAPKMGFAQLVSARQAVWGRSYAEGDRLSSGMIELRQGEIEIHFDKGTVARLIGPAALDLRTPDEVFLDHGMLTARVPSQAVGFTVVTPISRVVDLGTEFDVSVEESGKTETLVREGRVVLNPQRTGELSGKPIELFAGGLDRAVSSVPDIAAPVLPVSTVASGPQSQFVGIISVDGKTMEFESLNAFRQCEEQMLVQLQEAPAQFRQKWSIMVNALANSGSDVTVWTNSLSVGDMSGAGFRSVTVNEGGKTISITEHGDSGIVVIVLETVKGEQRRTVIYATDAQELEQKNAEAFHLYDRHFGGQQSEGGEGSDDDSQETPWPGMPAGHSGPPEMQDFLDNMRRQMEEEIEKTGRTGTPES